MSELQKKIPSAVVYYYCTWYSFLRNGCYIFYPFFTAVCIVERLVLQTIYLLDKEILQFLGLKSTVYNWERFQIKNGLYWRVYGTLTVQTVQLSNISRIYKESLQGSKRVVHKDFSWPSQIYRHCQPASRIWIRWQKFICTPTDWLHCRTR